MLSKIYGYIDDLAFILHNILTGALSSFLLCIKTLAAWLSLTEYHTNSIFNPIFFELKIINWILLNIIINKINWIFQFHWDAVVEHLNMLHRGMRLLNNWKCFIGMRLLKNWTCIIGIRLLNKWTCLIRTRLLNDWKCLIERLGSENPLYFVSTLAFHVSTKYKDRDISCWRRS